MKRKGRKHSLGFKAKAALAAIKNDKALRELAERFDIHLNRIQDWRKRLLENAESVSGRGQNQREESDGKTKDLYANIGQLTMERDF